MPCVFASQFEGAKWVQKHPNSTSRALLASPRTEWLGLDLDAGVSLPLFSLFASLLVNTLPEHRTPNAVSKVGKEEPEWMAELVILPPWPVGFDLLRRWPVGSDILPPPFLRYRSRLIFGLRTTHF